MRKLLVLFLILIASVSSSYAADWYVKKGATGTNSGTSWTNAWNEMNQIAWASISAGDTIWIAGGTYTTQLKPGKSGTSGNRIYIKRILSTDSVCTSPCDSSYDSQVLIDTDAGISWDSGTNGNGSYVTIDGRIDQGIRSQFTENNWTSSAIFMNTGNTGVVIRYVDAAGPGDATPYTHTQDSKVIQLRNTNGTITDLTLQYLRIHNGVDQIIILGVNGLLIEHSKLYNNLTVNSATYHPGMIASRSCAGTVTFRYNEMYNFTAEGIMLGATSGDIGCTWKLYGNKIYNGIGPARFLELQYVRSTVYAYNNTLVDLSFGFRALNGATWGAGSVIKNNILYNVLSPFAEGTAGIHDYNALSGINTETNGISNMPRAAFVNYSGGNFRIVSTVGASYPRKKGIALDPEYATDFVGISRPQGSAWDIGAYQYVDFMSAPPMPPKTFPIK